jgi:hypothetical protein
LVIADRAVGHRERARDVCDAGAIAQCTVVADCAVDDGEYGDISVANVQNTTTRRAAIAADGAACHCSDTILGIDAAAGTRGLVAADGTRHHRE